MSNKRNVMSYFVMAASAAAAGAAATGCAADAGEPASDASVAIAKVALANGATVSFYETAPGAIAVDQLTQAGVPMLDTGGMSAVQLYQSIAPGTAVPAALMAAQQRADAERTVRGLPLTLPAVPSEDSHVRPQISTADFESTYCFEDVSQWDFINCHADPFVTTGLSGTHDDIDALQTDICVNSGEVRWSANIEGDSWFSQDVPEHYCFRRGWSSGLSNADFITVTESIESATASYGLAVKWNH